MLRGEWNGRGRHGSGKQWSGVNPDFDGFPLLVIAVVKGIDYNFFNGLVGIAGDADALGPVGWFNDLFFDQLVLQYVEGSIDLSRHRPCDGFQFGVWPGKANHLCLGVMPFQCFT